MAPKPSQAPPKARPSQAPAKPRSSQAPVKAAASHGAARTAPRALDDDALAERMREELAREVEPQRAARLHHDLGVLFERAEAKPARAVEHYRKAAQLRPDHLPSLQGARRTLCALGRHAEALPLFDAELRLCAEPAERARLLLEKGRWLERLSRPDDALGAYREGLMLAGKDLDLLRAAARIERRAERWDALDTTLAQLAQALERDSAFKAAVLAERARIADLRKREPARAVELYVAALAIDPEVGGAAEAIKRLGQAHGQIDALLAVYEQEALRSADPEVRAAAGSRMAELLDGQLGDLERAISALELASDERPEDRALLERLRALYARKGAPAEQVAVLERLRELARDAAERTALSLQLAELADGALADPKRAEGYYLDVLATEPGQRAALQALAALYTRSGNHRGLLGVYARELDAQSDPQLKAELLARMGALWESGPRDVEQAAQHYARALGAQPDHDGALRALDRLLPALGRYRELALAYEQVIDKLASKEQAVAYLFRIAALYEDRLGEPKGAIAAYERVLRLYPDHLGALHALQRAALLAGEHAQALAALQREAKLIAPAPRAADLLLRAADLLAQALGDANAAIAQLEQLLGEHPNHALAHQRLAALYRSEQRWDGLLAQLARNYDQSASPDARAELALEIGQLYERRLGRLSDAIAAYDRALAARPSDVAAFAALCAALRASSKWAELGAALDARAKVSSEPHERAQLFCELGRLFEERLNDPLRALDAYARALDAQPGLRPALDARARLLWSRGDLPRLAKVLHEEAEQSKEPRLAIAALERAGALEAEALGDAKTALASYAKLLKQAPQHASALLAVEALGVALRDRKALAASYAAQAQTATDDQLKIAALRDLAQVASTPAEAAEAYRALCALRRDDGEALSALVEHARSEQDGPAELALRAQLAQAAGGRAASAAQHLAIAAQIEARDAAQALAAYRTALALDPESLVATRGLSRAALAFALPEALSDAARAEARVTRDVGVSVELLLRAADLRARSEDFSGAAKEAENALALDPGAARAAELLATVLTKAGEHAQLAELLARAAEATQEPERRADLYTQVAQLRAEHLQNLPAAVSAAERALAAKPEHGPAVFALARYFEAMGRWAEAIELHERSSGLARDPAERAAALLSAATLAIERGHDVARGNKNLRAVLASEPDNRRALLLQAKLLASSGKHGDMLALLRKLVETAADDGERVAGLLELARAEEREGHGEPAEQALRQALALAGPDSEAERAYCERLGRHASYERYVEALRQHLAAQRKRGQAAGRTLLAIARVQADELNDRAGALATLEQGTRADPDDIELSVEHASRLAQERKPDAAIVLLRAQLKRAPDRPELWLALSHAHRSAGRLSEALSSALPLLVLDAAAGEQRVALQTRKARPADSAASFGDALVRELDPAGVLDAPAALLAQTLAPVLAKLRPVELSSYGVSRRDRVPDDSDQTLRLAIDRVARMLGAPECEVYVHDMEGSEVELGLAETPALLVPRSLLSKSKSQLVFALARTLFCLRYELSAVAALPSAELAVLLAGTVRRQQPGYGASSANEDELDEASRVISKAVPWLSRKRIDEVAATVAAQG
ncbi:MAG TPA: tetratricopeptide repeat protein, partial [Polyangiales bacterium]|nr:tetratricopeptide repeat protein [Polyangiales bacterium]